MNWKQSHLNLCRFPEKGREFYYSFFRKIVLAFERRLIFTVGRSLTTGRDDAIIWNDIHHKTVKDVTTSPHGYPDANYLNNVLRELKDNGVSWRWKSRLTQYFALLQKKKWAVKYTNQFIYSSKLVCIKIKFRSNFGRLGIKIGRYKTNRN